MKACGFTFAGRHCHGGREQTRQGTFDIFRSNIQNSLRVLGSTNGLNCLCVAARLICAWAKLDGHVINLNWGKCTWLFCGVWVNAPTNNGISFSPIHTVIHTGTWCIFKIEIVFHLFHKILIEMNLLSCFCLAFPHVLFFKGAFSLFPGGGGVLGKFSDRNASHRPSTRNTTRVKKRGWKL